MFLHSTYNEKKRYEEERLQKLRIVCIHASVSHLIIYFASMRIFFITIFWWNNWKLYCGIVVTKQWDGLALHYYYYFINAMCCGEKTARTSEICVSSGKTVAYGDARFYSCWCCCYCFFVFILHILNRQCILESRFIPLKILCTRLCRQNTHFLSKKNHLQCWTTSFNGW